MGALKCFGPEAARARLAPQIVPLSIRPLGLRFSPKRAALGGSHPRERNAPEGAFRPKERYSRRCRGRNIRGMK